MSTALTYCSYAKINLYLDVLNKRRDGYNNIETIFQTVSLADTLSFEDHPHRISLTCSRPELASEEENLVYRAAMLLRDRAGCSLGAKIHLDKRIPIAAGLAGGSGNAAAAMVALNVLWNLRWSPGRLRALALELGSDVPYCTLGGTAAATRRGEELKLLRPLKRTWFVLLHPPLAISASYTYNHPMLGRSTQQPFAGRTPAFREAIRGIASGNFRDAIFNRMEDAVFHDHPNLSQLKKRLLELGCVAAAMSGSGPTLFGICENKRTATRIADAIPDYTTSVVCSVPLGVERVQ